MVARQAAALSSDTHGRHGLLVSTTLASGSGPTEALMAVEPLAPTTTIPAELRERPQWVAWRYERRPGEEKPTKVPYSARSGRRASSTDASTWSSYELACQYQQRAHLDGLGFVFTDDDEYVCLDLDHVRDPDT